MAEGKRERKIYSLEQKIIIVRELLNIMSLSANWPNNTKSILMISTIGRKSSLKEQRSYLTSSILLVLM